jgi:CheY-like chemotaxis protein
VSAVSSRYQPSASLNRLRREPSARNPPCGTPEPRTPNPEPGTPNHIVAEVGIPEADAIDLIRRFRGEPCTARIPVIVLTASTDVAPCLYALK